LDSKRTTHGLAYFEGSSRIVLSDNLLRKYLTDHPDEDLIVHANLKSRLDLHRDENNLVKRAVACNEEEIVALVAHEMGINI
jgi:hypothetical protein